MRIVEEEAQLGSTKLHHEKVRIVPRDKLLSETDKVWVRAGDQDVNRHKPVTTKGA